MFSLVGLVIFIIFIIHYIYTLYFWNKSFPGFGHFRISNSDRKTVPSSSVIKVWQRERIQDTFDTSGRANLERKLAWELFSWRWSLSKILDHGGRGCRSRLTICQLIQFYTNSEAALLSRQTPLYVTFFVRTEGLLFYNILIVSCLSAICSDYCGKFFHNSYLISHIHRTNVKLKWKSSLILYWAWRCEVVSVFTLGAPSKKTFLRKGRA